MALWQTITFAALIVALFVYAIVLTRRIGRAGARLMAIEKAPFIEGRPVEPMQARLAEAEPDVSAKDARRRYLTVRDLKATCERGNPPPRSPHKLEPYRGSRKPRCAEDEPCSHQVFRGSPRVRDDKVVMGSEFRDAAEPSSESLQSLSAEPEHATAVAANSASGNALRITVRPQSSADCLKPGGESVAKKDQDALLLLSSQRRRRRARLGD